MKILLVIFFSIVLHYPIVGQYFNKSYETAQNALGTYNVEIVAQDTFILFPATLQNKLGFSSILIDSSGDTIHTKYFGKTYSSLYTGWANSTNRTNDNNFIMGGGFELHQGLVRNNVSKIDSNGLVDPNYFNGLGPDSSFILGTGYAAIYDIIPSAFGGYYVAGDFLKWDGKPSQPIVRLHGLLSGIEENNSNSFYVDVFPNPSEGQVMVRAENRIREIQIFNAQGKFVKTIEGMNNNEFTIHITKANGLYLINLLDIKGNHTSLKLIKNSR